jgi:hypothetical protein
MLASWPGLVGLVPAIPSSFQQKNVDARDERGRDREIASYSVETL